MDQEIGVVSILKAVGTLLLEVVVLLAATGAIGWGLFALTPLTLAQGIFVAVGTYAAAVIALLPYGANSLRVVHTISVVASLLISMAIAFLAWPIDLLTSLTRWDATLYVFGVFNSVAFLFLRQTATALAWIDELKSIAEESGDEKVIDMPPAASRAAGAGTRRRRKQR